MKISPARHMRDVRQTVGNNWVRRAFGARFLTPYNRTERVLEEAIELAQALDFPKERIHELIDLVYAKERGEVRQEVGGVSNCLLSLCETLGISADECESDELNRVLALPVEHFQAKLKAKLEAGICTEPQQEAA